MSLKIRSTLDFVHKKNLQEGDEFNGDDIRIPRDMRRTLSTEARKVNCFNHAPDSNREDLKFVFKGPPNRELCSGCPNICGERGSGCPPFEKFDRNSGPEIDLKLLPRRGDIQI